MGRLCPSTSNLWGFGATPTFHCDLHLICDITRVARHSKIGITSNLWLLQVCIHQICDLTRVLVQWALRFTSDLWFSSVPALCIRFAILTQRADLSAVAWPSGCARSLNWAKFGRVYINVATLDLEYTGIRSDTFSTVRCAGRFLFLTNSGFTKSGFDI